MIDRRKLEAFATSSRTELVQQVAARVGIVLAASSTARVEASEAVRALEKVIAAHGGGKAGRQYVTEQQAYVWFNRIVALRFMDANRYTNTPVVSPPEGFPAGQPASLAVVKRGDFDPEVYCKAETRQRITGLLNGSVPSSDPQGEAYGLVLAAHCAYWSKSMPLMFQPEGNYTSLLMPANLLVEGSVLDQAVQCLAPEDCQDVEVIGWLYQYYIAERKNQVMAGFKKGLKAGPNEIPPATQLFTPDWIVRYLVQNSVGRLWLLNHPESQLAQQMEHLIAPEGDLGEFLHIDSPQELTVCDPACGSGHMLTYAFDLLYAIYAEQGYAPSKIPGLILTHNLFGLEIDERAGALAAFALCMKARAKQRRFFTTGVRPSVCVLEPVKVKPDELDGLIDPEADAGAQAAFWNAFEHANTFGSLLRVNPDRLALAKSQLAQRGLSPFDGVSGDSQARLAERWDQHESPTFDQVDLDGRLEQVVNQAEFLARQYSVVVTNPPYMGSRNMSTPLATWLRDEYPSGRSDLMTAFMLRADEMAHNQGTWAIINLPSWMFLKSFETLREWLVSEDFLCLMAHLGRGVFGSDFGSVAFIVQKARSSGRKGVYRRLFEQHVEVRSVDKIEALFLDRAYNSFAVDQKSFRHIPGTPIVYWLSEKMRRAFTRGQPIAQVAKPCQGLSTGDVMRFVRQWWEIDKDNTAIGCRNRPAARATGRRWFPYNKGGEFRRWHGNQQEVVNWENDGAELTGFRPRSVLRNPDTYFMPSVAWSDVTSGAPAFRRFPPGFIHDVVGMSLFSSGQDDPKLLALLNSAVAAALLQAIAPTLHLPTGYVAKMPVPCRSFEGGAAIEALVAEAKRDWDDFETSWDFGANPLLTQRNDHPMEQAIEEHRSVWDERSAQQQALEEANNRAVAELYDLADEVPCEVPLERVSLTRNTAFRWPGKNEDERKTLFAEESVKELLSYTVGCIFGRYSLDQPGLILASQGESLGDYLAKVPEPRFRPNAHNVIPFTGETWFEGGVVARCRQFLRVAFGQDHFDDNLAYIDQTLGKQMRQYFLRDFYADHIKRYKGRPIYWLFSTRRDGKGAFNALIYLHRYTPETLSHLLNDYLREFQTKLQAEANALKSSGQAADQKKANDLALMLTECQDYERDVLYPLVSRNLRLDLDDGVLVNYLRLGRAVAAIPAIEKNRRDVEGWTWPKHPLRPEDGV
ncbi:MAG: BREX-1 system adenine-specific DNA-methyltransferase PglX [Micrococcales bacterium]|nr:BREX-1 system adenine-specific DNA-methyltransferase PglX [Micrococcales bacterium]